MDPARVQRNLRDLINLPGEVMATPGAKVDDIAAAAAGQRAQEQAKARAEESRIGLKELALQKQGEAWGREMETGREQAGRATIYSGVGALIQLGSAHLMQKKADEIMDKMMGQQGITQELIDYMNTHNEKILEAIGIRKKQQKDAYPEG